MPSDTTIGNSQSPQTAQPDDSVGNQSVIALMDQQSTSTDLRPIQIHQSFGADRMDVENGSIPVVDLGTSAGSIDAQIDPESNATDEIRSDQLAEPTCNLSQIKRTAVNQVGLHWAVSAHYGLKRHSSMLNSAATTELSTHTVKVKRRKGNPSKAQIANDCADVQQTNMPSTCTSSLQVNSVAKQLQSGTGVEVTEKEFCLLTLRANESIAVCETSSLVEIAIPLPDTLADVDCSRSSLSTLPHQTAESSLPELLPRIVVKLMRDKMENVQVLMECQWLINQYSSEQQSQLEIKLKRSLTEVLLSVVKRHSHNTLIVETFCDLLSKLWLLWDIDFNLGPLDYLLEMICEQNSLTTMAKKAIVNLLWHIAGKSDVNRRNLIRDKDFVENICRLVESQMNRPEYSETIEISWNCLRLICSESVTNQRRFLHLGGIRLFQRCCEMFGSQIDLVANMTNLLLDMRSRESIHISLMANENLSILWEMWRSTNVPLINSCCFRIFFDFLTVSPDKWLQGIEEVKQKLTNECGELLDLIADEKTSYKERNSSLVLLSETACKPEMNQTYLLGENVVEKICQSISIELRNRSGQTDICHEANLKISWECLEYICRDSLANMDKLLANEGLRHLYQCCNMYNHLPRLVSAVGRIMSNLSGAKSNIKYQLDIGDVEFLWEIQTETRNCEDASLIRSIYVPSFANFLSVSDNWPLGQGQLAIDFMLDVIVGQNAAKRSSAYSLLKAIVDESCTSQQTRIGRIFVEKICQSIKADLSSPESDEHMTTSLTFLSGFCFANQQSFIDAGGMSLFQHCHERFKNQSNPAALVLAQLMLRMSKEEPIRQTTILHENLTTLWAIWSNMKVTQGEDEIYTCYFQIFSNFLSIPRANWPVKDPSKAEVEQKLTSECGKVVELICHQQIVTSRLKRTSSMWLSGMVRESVNLRNLIGETTVKTICQSIDLSLRKLRDDNKAHHRLESMEISWKCLRCTCADSLRNQQTVLEAGVIGLFHRTYQIINTMFGTFRLGIDYMVSHLLDQLIYEMSNLLFGLSERGLFRRDLAEGRVFNVLRQIRIGTKDDRVRSNCSQIFTNFLFFSPYVWPLGQPTKEQVEKQLGISCRLEFICGPETTLRRSSLRILSEFAFDERNWIGQSFFVEDVCQSIRFDLRTFEYSEDVEIGWECIMRICRDSVANKRKFVDADGISLFKQAYEFCDEDKLIEVMTKLMLDLCKEDLVRQYLIVDEMFEEFFWKIWIRENNEDCIDTSCAQIFSFLLSAYPINWPLTSPTRLEVENKLRDANG